VSSHGSSYAAFRRALDAGQATSALVAARSLPQVGLRDALELVLLLAAADESRFPLAAARWHGRFVCEVRGVELTESAALLACLAAVGHPGVRPRAAPALAELLARRGQEPLAEAVLRWAEGH